MSEWDKRCEQMTDLAELYKFTKVWGRTKAEGDRMQDNLEAIKKHVNIELLAVNGIMQNADEGIGDDIIDTFDVYIMLKRIKELVGS